MKAAHGVDEVTSISMFLEPLHLSLVHIEETSTNNILWFRKREAIAVELLERALGIVRVREIGRAVIGFLLLHRPLQRRFLRDDQVMQIVRSSRQGRQR